MLVCLCGVFVLVCVCLWQYLWQCLGDAYFWRHNFFSPYRATHFIVALHWAQRKKPQLLKKYGLDKNKKNMKNFHFWQFLLLKTDLFLIFLVFSWFFQRQYIFKSWGFFVLRSVHQGASSELLDGRTLYPKNWTSLRLGANSAKNSRNMIFFKNIYLFSLKR